MAKIILSEDGSHTLFSEKFQVTYHSTHGSLQESTTIFINAGLKYLTDLEYTDISIFEMGFGSGLNSLLAMIFGRENHIKIKYTGIEAYPIDFQTASKLNYSSILKLDEIDKVTFLNMHSLLSFTDKIFQFHKVIGKIEDYTFKESYDIIFYDAFSPESQANLWEDNLMQKIYDSVNPGGILVTYCAKGEFKRVLKRCGFKVEGLPGPKGKREITRAIKPK